MAFSCVDARCAEWGRFTFKPEVRAQWSEGDAYSETDAGAYASFSVPSLDTDGSFSVSGAGRYRSDLGTASNGNPFAVPRGASAANLYRLELDYRSPVLPLSTRAGRFDAFGAEIATLDGLSVAYAPCGWATFELFGGFNVADTDVTPDGKFAGGANVSLRSAWDAVFTFEQFHYYDDSYRLGARIPFPHGFSSSADYKMVNGSPQELRLTVGGPLVKTLELSFDYFQRMRYGDENFIYDFTTPSDRRSGRLALGKVAPYSDYGTRLRWDADPDANLWLRYKFRRLYNEEDEDEYNSNSLSGELCGELRNWPSAGVRLSATVSHWAERRKRSDLSENSQWGYSVEAEKTSGSAKFGMGAYNEVFNGDGAARTTTGFRFWGKYEFDAGKSVVASYERATDDLYSSDGFSALNAIRAGMEMEF